MVSAYILIDISIEVDEPEALATIRAVPGVKMAHLVVGPNDCIAYVEVDTQEQSIGYAARHSHHQRRTPHRHARRR